MQVVIDLESIFQYESGRIFGGIYIEADNMDYPAADWTDFVVILSWWSYALNTFQYLKPKETVELQFMDGPYSIRLEYLDNHTAQSRFIARGQSTTIIQHEQIVDMDLFKASLKKCMKQVLNKCYREGWQGNDVVSLETTLKTLSR